MAVPKGKVSKSRGAKRFASNYKVKVPTLVECPQCHGSKQAHKVCPVCGFYDGKEVVAKKEEAKG